MPGRGREGEEEEKIRGVHRHRNIWPKEGVAGGGGKAIVRYII